MGKGQGHNRRGAMVSLPYFVLCSIWRWKTSVLAILFDILWFCYFTPWGETHLWVFLSVPQDLLKVTTVIVIREGNAVAILFFFPEKVLHMWGKNIFSPSRFKPDGSFLETLTQWHNRFLHNKLKPPSDSSFIWHFNWCISVRSAPNTVIGFDSLRWYSTEWRTHCSRTENTIWCVEI